MPKDLSLKNKSENKSKETPSTSNTNLVVLLVVLIVIGFSSAAALIGYLYATKTVSSTAYVSAPVKSIPSESVPSETTQPTSSPATLPSPKPTLAPNANGKTFNSEKLGAGFYYAPKAAGSSEVINVTETADTIYVYSQGTPAENGQSVKRFSKNPSISLSEAISEQHLQNIPTDKCFVKTLSQKGSITTATIDYPVPANSDEPFFMYGDECPNKYKRTNGIRYFYYDATTADRYYFFSIGQYGIPAYSNSTSTSWQDTFVTY